MGAHLNAYSTREHTAYYIKALSKDLPKGNAWRKGQGRGDRTSGVQRTGLQELGLAEEWGYPDSILLQQGNQACHSWGGCAITGLRWPTWCPHLPFLHLAVELLADIVQNCSLEDSQIEKERDVILQELQENDACMRDVVFDYLHATAFQGTPLAQAVEGPSGNVR